MNWRHIVFAFVFILFSILTMVSAALSHTAATGWAYDPSCCSGQDCEALPWGAVEDTKDGWHVRYRAKRGLLVDVIVPYGKERDSQDGRDHGCATPDRFLCLYKSRTV